MNSPLDPLEVAGKSEGQHWPELFRHLQDLSENLLSSWLNEQFSQFTLTSDWYPLNIFMAQEICAQEQINGSQVGTNINHVL